MSENADCPSPDQLHRALTGELPPDRVHAIEQHLLECGACAEQTLHTGDLQTYSQALRESAQRGAGGASSADAEQLEQLIDRVRRLPHQQEATQLSGVTKGSGESDLESDLIRYLQPARAETELGWLGTYRVLKLLGSGGMGGVFLAEDTQLHRRVALKVMRPDISGQANADERFLREARAAAAVHHDHIVTIFQVGRDGQVPFLAMEFLEGESLEDRLRRERVMPLADILRIGREIAEGLAAAHARGLVHRDIKPANIWLESRGGHLPNTSNEVVPPRVKLLDFGLARSADVNFELTSQGMVIGTPAYMAPEQAAGDMLDHRADLFSLGIVLYRLATGVLPFQGKDAIATLVAIRSDTPDDPRKLRTDLPSALCEVIIQLLHKNPAERPASAAEVASRLAEIPLSASPDPVPRDTPTLAYQHQPPGKSRGFKWIVTAGALFFLCLMGVIVVIATDGGQVELDSKVDDVDVNVVVTQPDGTVIKVFDKKTGSRVQWFWSGEYQVALNGNANSVQLDKTRFTLKRGEKEVLTLTRKKRADIAPTTAPNTATKVAANGGATIPEPPPLSEWLKGRKVLTVAQDGSGQFKTIQAALNALQPGQVVKVLDRGPYTESLRCTVPRDTGLISDVQTVLEATDWPAKEHPHHITVIEGFRLNGLRLQARFRARWFEVLHVITPSGLVVENCSFGLSVPDPDHTALCFGLQLWFDQHRRALQPVWIRECLLEKSIGADGPLANGTIVVENNLFRDCGVAMSNVELQTLVVRHNVFENPTLHPSWYGDPTWFGGVSSVKETLEIVNNTASMPSDSRSTGVHFVKVLPPSNVVIRNNLFDSNVVLNNELWNGKPNSLELWQVDHNGYSREYRPQMRAKTDVVGKLTFLSTDTTNADAWRIAVDSPLAAGGAGGSLPGYIGALPPGPAPKDGDWFTRLRQRWGDGPKEASTIPPPIKIAEPPPLAEWLKGRKILTVAQDGKAEFKSIEAALKALRPSQVVEVLDRGPYREFLRVGGLPQDTGLISRHDTVIETPAWDQGGKDVGWSIDFGPCDGFRLSGISFVAPVREEYGGIMVLHDSAGVAIEDCHFGPLPRNGEGKVAYLILVRSAGDTDAKTQPVLMKNCHFQGGLVELGGPGESVAPAVFEQNYFERSGLASNARRFQRMIVRGNIFSDPSLNGFWMKGLEEVGESLEFSNNTCAETTFYLGKTGPIKNVTLRNNLTHSGVHVGSESQGKINDLKKNWQQDHNGYILPTLLRSPSDVLSDPKFLSTDANNRDYLRIPIDNAHAIGGAGGNWPKYIGALPPGPAPKEGDWFTRLRERWGEPLKEASNIPPPINIAEPPPLAEWLKGRKVLTVAQDGSGQFKTINEAIQQLKSGQAIKVMDRGPYRELIDLASPPEDSGLIGSRDTVIELPNWIDDPQVGAGVRGHRISSTDRFRLSGLTWLSPPGEKGDLLRLWLANGIVVEQCVFRSATKSAVLVQFDPQPQPQTVHIRECGFFDGALLLGGDARHGRLIIENNYFHKRGSLLSWQQGRFGRLVFRHNVCDYLGPNFHGLAETSNGIELSNNTILAPGPQFVDAAPARGVTIRNNIVRYGVPVYNAAGTLLPPAQWHVDHNGYLEYGKGPSKPLVAQSPTDVAQDPDFLSVDSTHRDYARIPADAPAGTAGAGGDWPGYLGALPPGPAPKEGDWFTRLQERWSIENVKRPETSSPVKILEPPPLGEWLKGRKVLTVAQDGSGQFKTIQAALDALEPGEAVKVLDKGPYRERLELSRLPQNSGIISNVRTILDVPEWKVNHQEPDKTTGGEINIYAGHLLSGANGFRLHGFEMQFPPSGGKRVRRILMNQTKGFVLENCLIHASESYEGEPIDVGDWDGGDGAGISAWMRECVIEGSASFTTHRKGPSSDAEHRSTVVIERNYFLGSDIDHHLVIAGQAMNQVAIRHNVFAGKSIQDILLVRFGAPITLEVSNNSLLSSRGIVFSESAPRASVTIRNNLHSRDGIVALVNAEVKELHRAVPGWSVDHNAYPDFQPAATSKDLLPRPPGDLATLPRFLSKVPQEVDYLRIPADDPLATEGAGGEWPIYIGALPPGLVPTAGDWFSRLRDNWTKEMARR